MDNFNDITEEEFIPSDDAAKHTDEIAEERSEAAPELKRTIISDEYSENSVFEEKQPKKRLRLPKSPDLGFKAAAACIAAVIASGAFIAGQTVRKDTGKVEESYAKQRQMNSRYNELIESIASIQAENDTLYQERDRIKSEADALRDYAEKSTEIETGIAAMEEDLEQLNTANASKQAEIDKLTDSTEAKRTASIINLTPGMYTVGTSIAPGRYSVTGSGKITVSNSGGGVKKNIVLTADSTEIILDEGDRIRLDTRARFTASQQSSEPPQEGSQ